MNSPKTRAPAGDAPETRPTPALKIPTQELHEAWHGFALNSEYFTTPIRQLLMPSVKPELWNEYVEAVGDIWDLNHGDDPFPYCPDEVDWKRFSAADARAFAIDERTERRDAALAQLLDAIQSAAPDRDAP